MLKSLHIFWFNQIAIIPLLPEALKQILKLNGELKVGRAYEPLWLSSPFTWNTATIVPHLRGFGGPVALLTRVSSSSSLQLPAHSRGVWLHGRRAEAGRDRWIKSHLLPYPGHSTSSPVTRCPAQGRDPRPRPVRYAQTEHRSSLELNRGERKLAFSTVIFKTVTVSSKQVHKENKCSPEVGVQGPWRPRLLPPNLYTLAVQAN